jgi:hypothetical protein
VFPRCAPLFVRIDERCVLLESSTDIMARSRYVNVSSCNYIVDLDGPWQVQPINTPESSSKLAQAEEHYTLRSDFSVVASLPFMRAGATPALLRWLWMPQRMLAAAAFDSYVLLEKKGNPSSQ